MKRNQQIGVLIVAIVDARLHLVEQGIVLGLGIGRAALAGLPVAVHVLELGIAHSVAIAREHNGEAHGVS